MPLPGLEKAEGRTVTETIPLTDDEAALRVAVAEANAAERIAAATQETEFWKRKFKGADEEISRYQRAIAVLVAEDDPRERQKIRDSLQGPDTSKGE